MPDLKRLERSASAKAIAAAVSEDGAVIIENVLDRETLQRVRREITPYVEATPTGVDDFTGRKTTRTGALVARSPAVRDLVMNRAILKAAEDFLAPFCSRIQLHLTQVIRIQPGQSAQMLHRDRLAWGGYLPQDLEPQFNTIWAVSDFTAQNGATRVAPGSNRWDYEREPNEADLAPAEMKAGSVIVYSGSVIHSGGANTSDIDRIGINITYALGWLRQEENQYLSCPPHIAKDLPEDLRALLGYTMGSYALGYFTPPLPPGEGPEVSPPEALFQDAQSGDWNADLLAQVSERAKSGAA